MRQDLSEGNGQLFLYKQYQQIYIDFSNIIQPAWDTGWVIADNEWRTQYQDILPVKIFAEHLKNFKQCICNFINSPCILIWTHIILPGYIVRITGPLHEPKLFNFKLIFMRHNDHKNGTPSVAKRHRVVCDKSALLSGSVEKALLSTFSRKNTIWQLMRRSRHLCEYRRQGEYFLNWL